MLERCDQWTVVGKNFPETWLVIKRRKEDLKEPRIFQLIRIWHFPTSGCPNKCFEFNTINMCHLNEYFPLEPIGWLHFWPSSRSLLLTLPDPPSVFLVLAVGKKKKKVENVSEPGKEYWDCDSSFNWTTSNRSSLGMIFSPSLTSRVTKRVRSVWIKKMGGAEIPQNKMGFFFFLSLK